MLPSKYNVVFSNQPIKSPQLVTNQVDIPQTYDLSQYMSVVTDQGALGSCTGSVFASAVEYTINREAQKIHTDPGFTVLSRLFVYYNERVLGKTVNYDVGATMSDGINALRHYGICTESLWPYSIEKFRIKPSPAAYHDALTRKLTGYTQVPTTEQSLLATLAAGYPITIAVRIFAELNSASVAISGNVPMPWPGSASIGGHAMLLCGFDQASRRFKVRNSWGNKWGIDGYCFFPFEYILNPELAGDAWVVSKITSD